MPRRARIALPNVPVHLIQRGNNRQPCFFADEDYRRYLDWLTEYAGKTGCRIHAYALMTNHVHLLLSSDRADAGGALMKLLGQRYVQGVILCQVLPLDKSANANGQRKRLAPVKVDLSPLPPTGMSALMIELLADYAATGVPPAYLPTVEESAT